jgi:hypothetical protein
MYLDVADSANLPYGWSRYAQFSMKVVDQINNKYSVRKGSLFSLLLTVVKNKQILPPVTIISEKSLFRFNEKVMYLVNNVSQIHYFFNESKK